MDVPADHARDQLAGLFVVQLFPPARVADEWKDPRAELRVVGKRRNRPDLQSAVLPWDREDVEPNPDLMVAVNAEVGFHVFQPPQLRPLVVVRVVRRLPIVGHEVGERAIGHLRVALGSFHKRFTTFVVLAFT